MASDVGVVVTDGNAIFKVGTVKVKKTALGGWKVVNKTLATRAAAIVWALEIELKKRND